MSGQWLFDIGLPREIPGRDSVAYFTGVIWLRRHSIVIQLLYGIFVRCEDGVRRIEGLYP